MTILRSAFLALSLLGSAAPAIAVDVDPQSIVPQVASVIETRIGIPIIELERHDDDQAEFWYRAMRKLCDRTGDNWCDDDVHILQDTTNPMGWARRLAYEGRDGSAKQVCVVLPPRPGIAPGYVATTLASSAATANAIPSASTARMWVWLLHVASCAGQGAADVRSDAFATLATTLIRGDTGFISQSAHSEARWFSAYRNASANHWATNVGERILLDLWKGQAAAILQTAPCRISATSSTSLATDTLRPDGSLPQGGDCTEGPNGTWSATGTVTDENLWLWTVGGAGSSNPRTNLPPQPYAPFGSFGSLQDGINYAWDTSAGLK